MAKVFGYSVTPEIQELIERSLMPNWNLSTFQLILKNRELSVAKIKSFGARSRMLVAAAAWRALSPSEKYWQKITSPTTKWSGWNVSLAQYCAALKEGTTDWFSTEVSSKGKAGCIYSPTLNKTIEIRQGHPTQYYQAVRVPKTKSRRVAQMMFEENRYGKQITMSLNTAGLNNGFEIWQNQGVGGPHCEIKVTVRNYYGQYRGTTYTDYSRTYGRYIRNMGVLVLGNAYGTPYAGYDVIIKVKDYQGLLFFNNTSFAWGGYNFARDPYTKFVDEKFAGHLKICQPNWEWKTTYDGAKFYSRGFFVHYLP